MTTPAPKFATAVPQRRYKIGEFQAVVLGEIDSQDDAEYEWVFALVREGEGAPVLYITLERVPDGETPYQMVVRLEDQSKAYPAGNEMRDIENFAAMSIDAVVQLFKLQDEEPYRIL